jgi:hypothetical protein
MQRSTPTLQKDVSPDHADRIQDFYSRHGGPGRRPPGEGETAPGIQGWSEVYAADGHAMRCEWSRFGSHEDMKFSEIAPRNGKSA